MLRNIKLTTQERGVTALTDDVKAVVEESGVQEGLCVICIPHTTAGLTITSFWDPNGFLDLQDEICRLIPTRIDFKHQHDTPQDAAGPSPSTRGSCCWATPRGSTSWSSTVPGSGSTSSRSRRTAAKAERRRLG